MREKHSREPSLAGVSFHSKKIHVAFPNWPLHARLCDPGGDSAATFREPGAARSGRRSGGDLPLSRHPPPSPASSFLASVWFRPTGAGRCEAARGAHTSGERRPEAKETGAAGVGPRAATGKAGVGQAARAPPASRRLPPAATSEPRLAAARAALHPKALPALSQPAPHSPPPRHLAPGRPLSRKSASCLWAALARAGPSLWSVRRSSGRQGRARSQQGRSGPRQTLDCSTARPDVRRGHRLPAVPPATPRGRSPGNTLPAAASSHGCAVPPRVQQRSRPPQRAVLPGAGSGGTLGALLGLVGVRVRGHLRLGAGPGAGGE